MVTHVDPIWGIVIGYLRVAPQIVALSGEAFDRVHNNLQIWSITK